MALASASKAEKSFIQAGILSAPPSRADGRGLHDFRPVALETGVAPLANGSARLSIGQNPHDGSGGTAVLAATKLEVEDVGEEGVDGGRIVCMVSCSPAAYPHRTAGALDDLQHDMTAFLHQTIAAPSLHPPNLGILPGKKSWLLSLDVVVLADSGNIHDALFMAARAALWDTRVPRTRSVEYRAPKGGSRTQGREDMDTDQEVYSGLDTRRVQTAADFELTDYWDEGEVLGGRDGWPVCITLNVVAPLHYLDASLYEEAATPLRLLLVFSFPPSGPTNVQAMRMFGPGELTLSEVKGLLKEGETYARELCGSLNAKLDDEDVRRTLKLRSRFERR